MKPLQLFSALLISFYLGACSAEPSGAHTHDDGTAHAEGNGHDHEDEGHAHGDEGHGHDGADHDGGEHAAPLAAVMPSADATVRALKCGCAIDAVGRCSEFIEVEGDYVPLELPVDLGPMPFCRK
ncbi:MAG: hypothetical protein AAF368_06135, partial [Planctomycetota bacterium]